MEKDSTPTLLESPVRRQVVWREGNDQRDYRREVLPQELIGTRDYRIAASLKSMNHGLS